MAKPSALKVNWAKAAQSEKFQALLKSKEAFVVPAVIFFVVYYFALPILVGYMPELMSRKVWGAVNLAYFFALSQFFMAWIIAYLYLRAAGKFDKKAAQIVREIGPKRRRA